MNFLELDAGSSGAATDTVGPIDSLQKSQAKLVSVWAVPHLMLLGARPAF